MVDVSQLSDAQVIQIVRDGDKEIYAEIIKRYQDKLLRYATYISNDTDLAADAVQESFIKAYINLNGFDIRKKFSSWIYRIVHNESMNLLRKNKIHIALEDSPDFDSGISLEDDLIKKELISHTHACLNKISLIYREPLSLFYLEEKSYEDISDILRLPVGTVGTRINRAKVIMKKICQK